MQGNNLKPDQTVSTGPSMVLGPVHLQSQPSTHSSLIPLEADIKQSRSTLMMSTEYPLIC